MFSQVIARGDGHLCGLSLSFLAMPAVTSLYLLLLLLQSLRPAWDHLSALRSPLPFTVQGREQHWRLRALACFSTFIFYLNITSIAMLLIPRLLSSHLHSTL
jgi:hypothetical protein